MNLTRPHNEVASFSTLLNLGEPYDWFEQYNLAEIMMHQLQI